MHCELVKGRAHWHWRFTNKGRITATAGENFASMSNAERAAKAVINGLYASTCINPDTTPLDFSRKVITDKLIELHWT